MEILADVHSETWNGKAKSRRFAKNMELEHNLEGYARGVKTLLSSPQHKAHMQGLVADILEVPARYEAAIEAVLGERVQAHHRSHPGCLERIGRDPRVREPARIVPHVGPDGVGARGEGDAGVADAPPGRRRHRPDARLATGLHARPAPGVE